MALNKIKWQIINLLNSIGFYSTCCGCTYNGYRKPKFRLFMCKNCRKRVIK